MDVADVTVETFAGREGQRFWITFADAQLDLTLAEVTQPPEHWGAADREPFSVVLHGPLEHVLPQQIWPLEHDELERIELFLTPIGPHPVTDPEVMQYEAVFT